MKKDPHAQLCLLCIVPVQWQVRKNVFNKYNGPILAVKCRNYYSQLHFTTTPYLPFNT